MIQLSRLEGFWRVAREGGYARAARAFPYPITQPAVHQQVKKLEGEVGAPLFERVAKDRVRLTPAGERLFAFVDPFLSGLDGVVRDVADGVYGGTLRIHAAGLILRRLLPSWIGRLNRKRSGIDVELHEMERPDVELLRRGDADLLIDHLPDVPKGIATRTVAIARPFLVIPTTWSQARKSRLSLRDCDGETFVGYTPGSLPHQLQKQVLEDRGVTPTRVLSASTADAILGFVESGLGFSVVPSLDEGGPKGRGFKARLMQRPMATFDVVAAWRESSMPNPLLEAALATAPSV